MSCQVGDLGVRASLPCKARESGGMQCERLDPHGDGEHWISPHTIRHDRLGNGWVCADGEFVGLWLGG